MQLSQRSDVARSDPGWLGYKRRVGPAAVAEDLGRATRNPGQRTSGGGIRRSRVRDQRRSAGTSHRQLRAVRAVPRGILRPERDLVSIRRRAGVYRPRGAGPGWRGPQQCDGGARTAGDPLTSPRQSRPCARVPDIYRPHADQELRIGAYAVAIAFKARFGTDGWECNDIPPAEGETPVMGTFVKQRCQKVSGGEQIVVESRHYYKPGQALLDPNTGLPTVNQFESSARIQVVWVDALQK